MSDKHSPSGISESQPSSSENVNKEESSAEDVSAAKKAPDQQKEELKLKREMGLFSAVMLIVGCIIGSGIFITPKGVLQHTGSVAACLIVWTVCGLFALMGALCYAELGTAIPVSGAEYSYFIYVYGKKCRFGALPAFLYLWMCSLIIKTTTVAITLLTFAEYIVEPMFPTCHISGGIKKLIAVLAMGLITFVNCYSVKFATRLNNFFTLSKLLAIAIVISIGAYMLSKGNYQHLATGFEGSASLSELGSSFYFGLYAYDSWNNLNFMTEELQDPHVNLPRSIMIALPLVTVCYVLANVSYFTVSSPDEILASDAVAVGFARSVLGPAAFVIPLLVAISSYGAANGTYMILSRLPFAAARANHWAEVMSYIQVNHFTPTPALIFNALIICVMICAGNIGGLIDLFSFVNWIFYGGSMVSVIVLRFTERDLPRPYKVPIVIPIVMSVVSVYLVLAPLISSPKVEYLFAVIFLILGILVYIPFIHYGLRLEIVKKVYHAVQLMLVCAPADKLPD